MLVSGSAVGPYGNRGEEVLTEDSPPADDFFDRLCQGWELAAQAAERSGTHVVRLRTGLALGRDGRALTILLPLFMLGLGGPVGNGGRGSTLPITRA